MTAITQGTTVHAHYTGTLDDGTVFDSSKDREPLSFVVGEGKVIKGFEQAVLGMSVGEEKDITIPSQDAYGEPREDLIQTVPKTSLKDLTPEVGMVLALQVPGSEHVIPARVIKIEEETVTIDINPPLAGKTLHFHIKIESAS